MSTKQSLTFVFAGLSGLSFGMLIFLQTMTTTSRPVAPIPLMILLIIGLIASSRRTISAGITRSERNVELVSIGHLLFVGEILLPPLVLLIIASIGTTTGSKSVVWLERLQRLFVMSSASLAYWSINQDHAFAFDRQSCMRIGCSLYAAILVHAFLEGFVVALTISMITNTSIRERLASISTVAIQSLQELTVGAIVVVLILLDPALTLLNLPLCFLLTTQLRLREEARHGKRDARTGLLNLVGLDEFVSHEFARSDRIGNHVSIALFDLDYLRDVNNNWGHSVGDLAIATIANVLRTNCRSIDAVARIGGEEFVLVLPDTDIDDSFEAAQRIRAMIQNQIIETSQGNLQITASVGVATRFRDETYSDLFDRADQALYESKRAGRNRVTRSRHFPSSKDVAHSIPDRPSRPTI